ncbi:Bax inhibitor-1/YccA family protein [Priestia aryabhattai]
MDALHVESRSLFQKVLTAFIISLLIATVGLYVGQFIPTVYMLPLELVELGLIIAAFWLRKKKSIGYTFLYIFSFISGITMFPIVSHYASLAGAQIVLLAFGTTCGIFIIMGLIGSMIKRDLGFISNFLLVATLALVFVSIFNIFLPLTSSGMLAFSAIGSIIFSLWILYDFNQLKRSPITEEMVPLLALSLYLDFINLFINILRFFGILSSND